MNESFEGWVYYTLQTEDNPANRVSKVVGSEPHPLLSDTGKEAAEMAWDHQQAKIDQLEVDKNYLESSVRELLYAIRKLEGKE